MKLLKKGDRIRLKVRMMGGWKGAGTVTEDQYAPEGTVWFVKDGDPDEIPWNKCAACRHEVSVIREESPNDVRVSDSPEEKL